MQTIKLPLPEEFTADVLSAAMYGGINYWADPITHDQWVEIEASSMDEHGKDRVLVFDMNAEAVTRGILIALRDTFDVNDETRRTIAQAATELDASYIDAEAADVIIQASVFGEIVYC